MTLKTAFIINLLSCLTSLMMAEPVPALQRRDLGPILVSGGFAEISAYKNNLANSDPPTEENNDPLDLQTHDTNSDVNDGNLFYLIDVH